MARHSDLSGSNLHGNIRWFLADEAARNALSGLTAFDVGKAAHLAAENRIDVLIDESPVTWLKGVGGGNDHNTLSNLTAGDPHTQYQKESEKGQANGYAGLDANARVPTAQLGAGSASTSTFLRGDQSWASVPVPSVLGYRHVGTTTYHLAGLPIAGNLANGTPALDTLYALPFFEVRGGTIDRIAAHVNSAVASNVFRLGIYANTSLTNLAPGALILDSGELSGATTGLKTATINQVLTAGSLYWLVLLMGTAAAQMRVITGADAFNPLGVDTGFTNIPSIGWQKAQTYGALPDPFPASPSLLINTDVAPAIGVRYSA